VTVELAGRAPERRGAQGSRLKVTNRHWFSGVDDLEASWEVTVDGRRAGLGRLELPAIPPRSSRIARLPAAARPAGAGRAVLTVRFSPRRAARPSWAASDWIASTAVVELGGSRSAASGMSRQRGVDVGLDDDDGITVGDLAVGWPQLSLWRAPTDNDDPPGDWRPSTPAAGWRADGLDRLSVDEADLVRRGNSLTRVVRYSTGAGHAVEHRQRAETAAGGVRFTETISIDRALRDLPRVGVAFELPTEFDRLEWLGLGPGDSYPDRRAAVRFGRWEANVGELVVPFVRPQEYGLHLETSWFKVASADQLVRVTGARPLAFSALPHSVDELQDTTHAHRLPASSATHVHLDVAHRGLGTAACGPDTHPRHLVAGGTYRFSWTLAARRRRQSARS
jgi:beta-galactosidase